MKNSKLFYEARDAVEKGIYLKAKTRTLRKYLEELNIVQPWESDSRCAYSVQMKTDWVKLLEKEIEKRIDSRRTTVYTVSRDVLVVVVGGLILFFLLQYFQKNNQDVQNNIHKQNLQHKESNPQAIPSENKKEQSIKKTK